LPVAGVAPERVLVRLPNWLGDAIMARPLLHALRAAWPGARVLGVGPAGPCAPLADEGLVHELAAWPADDPGRAVVAMHVRAWRPDLALVLPASFSSAWLAWRSRAGVRVGYRGEWREPLLTRALTRAARGARHLSDEFLDLGAVLGLSEVAVPLLVPTPEGRAAAAAALASARVDSGAAYVVVGPRSAYGPAREWFPERFAEAGRALAARGLRVVVCGTAAEADACEAVARETGTAAVSLAGRTTLPALVALVAGARLALCNDSGLAHVAAATGAATLQIYGSAASGWTAARGPHVRILHRAPVCSPCWRRHCVIGTRCLDAVTVAWVLRQADQLVAEVA
jgi:heptosyltransferase-2